MEALNIICKYILGFFPKKNDMYTKYWALPIAKVVHKAKN